MGGLIGGRVAWPVLFGMAVAVAVAVLLAGCAASDGQTSPGRDVATAQQVWAPGNMDDAFATMDACLRTIAVLRDRVGSHPRAYMDPYGNAVDGPVYVGDDMLNHKAMETWDEEQWAVLKEVVGPAPGRMGSPAAQERWGQAMALLRSVPADDTDQTRRYCRDSLVPVDPAAPRPAAPPPSTATPVPHSVDDTNCMVTMSPLLQDAVAGRGSLEDLVLQAPDEQAASVLRQAAAGEDVQGDLESYCEMHPTVRAKPPAAPKGAKSCGVDTGERVFAGPSTSCEFAFEVSTAFSTAGSAPTSVRATSPVTGKEYTMRCATAARVTTCSGVSGATVYIAADAEAFTG